MPTTQADALIRVTDRMIEYRRESVAELQLQLETATKDLRDLEQSKEVHERLLREMPALALDDNEAKPPSEPKMSRRDTIIEYLKRHGMARREDLVDNLGIPRGTVAGILKNDATFEPMGEGRWMLRRKTESPKEDASETEPPAAPPF